MKKQFLLLSLLCMAAFSFAQSGDEKALLDKMSKEACKNIDKAGFKDRDDATELKVKLGVALLPVFQNNAQEIKKVWNLDINEPAQIRQVGEKLGQYAIYSCPKFQEITLMMLKKDTALAGRVQERLRSGEMADAPAEAAPSTEGISGTVSKIEGTDVSYIFVNTDDGETAKLLWLEDFEGSAFLTNGNYAGKKFWFSFVKRPIYQPQSKTYKDIKVITGLATM